MIETAKYFIKNFYHPLKIISIEPTNDCNMECPYCFRKERETGYMHLRDYFYILDQIPSSVNSVCLSFAGESGLHPNMNDFVVYTKIHGFEVTVYSNGTYIYPNADNVICYPKPPPIIITKDFKFVKDYNLKQVYTYCHELFCATHILWNGDVVPCCHDLSGVHVMGNVYQNNLMDIWNNEKYLRLRVNGFCKGCELYKYDLRLKNP